MVKRVLVTIIIVVLAIAMVFCGIGWGFAQQDLDATRTEVSSLEATLESTESELSAAKDELLTIEADLQATKNYLSEVEEDLQATKLRLSATQTDIFHLHNPTLEEITSFLREDKTDSNKYVEGTYVCSHFTRDVNNNAQNQGIRCAFVGIYHPDSAHAIVAFNTVDEGLVYFEPLTDERVRPIVGKEYWRCIEPRPGYYYEKPSFDDTIMDIVVIW